MIKRILAYNLLDQKIEEREECAKISTLLSKVTYDYDTQNNCTEVTRYVNENLMAIETTTFDVWDRPKRIQNSLGHVTTFVYDEGYRNEKGERVLQTIETNPLGHRTLTTHDICGRPALIEKQSQSGERLSLEKLHYDPAGNCIIQTSLLGYGHLLTTRFSYDSMNRLETLTQAAGAPEEKQTRYTYTPIGERKTVLKPDGVTLFYEYDPLCRLHEIRSSSGDCHYLYHYENSDFPTKIEDLIAHTSTQRSYDPHGRMTQEILAHGLTFVSHYDTARRRYRLDLPDHSSVLYTYNPLHVAIVTRLSPSGECLYTHANTAYNLLGNLKSQRLIENLATVDFETDLLGRTIEIRSPYFHQRLEEIDPCGNILSMQQQGEAYFYSYDPLNQLIEEKEHTYSADAHYRRLEKDGTSEKMNLLSELTHSYTYSDAGNPSLRKTDNLHYKYDALDRLIEVYEPNAWRLTFGYDAFHRRLTKTHFSWHGYWHEEKTTLFLYDDQKEIGVTEQDGTLTELRILGQEGESETGAAIALELQGKLYAPLHDLFSRFRYQYT